MTAETMNADRLLALYERVTDAPEAIPRLRRFVLNLAVRGRLVKQQSEDEPVPELLERIAAAKEQLIRSGEIKKPRNLSNGEEPTAYFGIPDAWRWCRLDTIGAIVGGGTPAASDPANFATPGEGIPWLTPADLGNYDNLHISHGTRDLSPKGLQSSSATLMPSGTVLFTSRAPIGYVAIAANQVSTNQGFKSIVPYVSDCSGFIALAMRAFAPDIDAKAPGTTFKEVSGKIVAGTPFPLPPLAEQHRIVAKVDELMTLLDRLEETRAAAEATRDRLTTVSLARLTAPNTTPEAFSTHARFALDTFPTLTTRADQIQSLRETVLYLAMRGKLVKQDPNDEPSSELLKRIAAEKTRLVQAREIKNKKVPAIGEEDIPYSTPASWTWTRLGAIGDWGSGSTPSRSAPDLYGGGITWLKSGELRDRIDLRGSDETVTEKAIQAGSFRRNRPGDVLIAMYGATIGRLAILAEEAVTNQAVCGCSPFTGVSNRFLFLFLLAQRKVFRTVSEGGAQPNISKEKIMATPFPLPPLPEQDRIVAKVDELMALCDRLEANLNTGNDTKQRLLEVFLHEALTGDTSHKEAA